jgi:uncharacterized lipoprotein NlpE involved in copper resistance
MKKVMFMLMAAVSMTFMACGNCSKSDKTAEDSVSVDSTVVDSVVVDTIVAE